MILSPIASAKPLHHCASARSGLDQRHVTWQVQYTPDLGQCYGIRVLEPKTTPICTVASVLHACLQDQAFSRQGLEPRPSLVAIGLWGLGLEFWAARPTPQPSEIRQACGFRGANTTQHTKRDQCPKASSRTPAEPRNPKPCRNPQSPTSYKPKSLKPKTLNPKPSPPHATSTGRDGSGQHKPTGSIEDAVPDLAVGAAWGVFRAFGV